MKKLLLRIPLLLTALLITSLHLSAHDFEVDGIYYNITDATAKTVEVTCYGDSPYSVDDEYKYSGDVQIPNSVTYSGTSYSVTSIGNTAFYNCTGLTSITIPSSVTIIGTYAFQGCSNLTKATLDHFGVRSIGPMAFKGCSNLTEINIPNSVNEIGRYAFDGCTNLKEVKIFDSIGFWFFIKFEVEEYTNIACTSNPLYYAEKLTLNGVEVKDLIISRDVQDYAFYGFKGLTSVTISNGVTSIGKYSFSDCSNLTSISIGKNIATIGYSAFAFCSGLESIIVDPENTVYDSRDNCNAIIKTDELILGCKNTVIPNSVTTIGSNAFSNCFNLTSITIPNSVKNIHNNAFYECRGLTSITIPNSVTDIFGGAFKNCIGLTEVNISDLSNWCRIKFYAEDANPLRYAHKLKLNGVEINNLAIPNDVSYIRDYAFINCTDLTSATIPSSVVSIGNSAFSGCTGLTSIKIPSSVTEIGLNAFFNTPWYENQSDGVIYISKVLYKYKGTMPSNTSVVVANGTQAIANEAFKGCSGLVSITIPSSVYSIGSAFTGCDNLVELNLGAYLNNYLYLYNLKRINILNSVKSLYLKYLPKATEINVEYASDALEIKHDRLESYYNKYYYDNAFKCNKLILNRPLKGSIYGYKEYNFSSRIFNGIDILGIGGDVGYIVESGYDYLYNGCSNFKKLYIEQSSKGVALGLPNDCPIDTAYIGRPVTNSLNLKRLKHVTVESEQLYSQVFAGCDSIQYMALPFAGAGTAQTVGNFGELFGTTKNDNMRAVTQLMEDGTTKTYYLPTGLKELVIGEGCEQLPYGALYNCSMIEKLTLPTTIKGVKENALYGCDGLTDIYVKRALPPSAYESSFTGVNQFGCTLHVPHNSKQYYSIATGWKYFYFIEEEAPLTVSVAKSIENAGEILGINQYQPGATAEMEAIAHSRYTFLGWYEDGALLTTDAKYSFTVTESHTLVAQFASLLNENDVTVTPQSEAVTLSWEQEDGAQSYGIELFSDADMTQPAGTMEVDQNGQVMTRSATSVSTTVSGLTSSMSYYYRITSYGDNRTVLSQYTGSFSTTAGVDAINADDNLVSYSVMPGMLVVNGEGDTPVMVADMNGRVLFSEYAAGQLELPLDAGIYILRLGNNAHKVAIR